jgi:hypothetical protein
MEKLLYEGLKTAFFLALLQCKSHGFLQFSRDGGIRLLFLKP